MIIDVASIRGGTVYAGPVQGRGNYVHAYYNKNTNTVGLEAGSTGRLYELGSMQPDPSDFGTSFKFAFVVNENRVVALVGDRFMDIGNFRPLIERDVAFETDDPDTEAFDPALDLRRKGVLATFKNGFGARSGSGRAILFDGVRAGYFGEAGVRDPHCRTVR